MLQIPFNFPTDIENPTEAIQKVTAILSGILKLDGDLFAVDGSVHPIIADKIMFDNLQYVGEDEL